jgi:hypothetical protein
MTSLHPVVLLAWLTVATCAAIVIAAIAIDWWERRDDERCQQVFRDRHHWTETKR